jgi:hypothetical protein
MSYGLMQSITVVGFFLITIAAELVYNEIILLFFFLNMLCTVWIEKEDPLYRDYLKKEALVVGCVSVLVFVVGVQSRSYFFGILFFFCVKAAYLFIKYNTPRLKICNLLLLFCYFCPILYFFIVKKQDTASLEKENSTISYLASINIIFAFFLISNSITLERNSSFGFDAMAIFLYGTAPTALILLAFLSMKKPMRIMSLYSFCKYGILLLISFFPWMVGLFLLWSICDSFRAKNEPPQVGL